MPIEPQSPENRHPENRHPENPPNTPPNDFVKLEFLVNLSDPNVLAGFDHLLNLGLLSDRQVRQLARQSLTCKRSRSPVSDGAVDSVATDPSQAILDELEPVRSREPHPPPVDRPRQLPRDRPALVPNVLTAFMAEISVVWLLCLGVFLVVVSSASLAAIQWHNFSEIGQYSILLIYTLMFGGAGLWASAQDQLKLTGRMLQVATLLIIPVNFWMMDGFQLWSSPIGVITIVIATALLGLLQAKLLQGATPRQRWNSLLLNGLHWGWATTIVPLLFTYIGTIITALIQSPNQSPNQSSGQSSGQRSLNPAEEPAQALPVTSIAFATFLLVGRAIIVKGIPMSRFGLAITIIGWLLYWKNRGKANTDRANQALGLQPLGLQLGAALLGTGWLVSYIPDAALIATGIDPLWQTLSISGLAILVLRDRLYKFWEKPVLVGFWVVGLQAYTLLRVIIPPSTRQSVMSLIAQWANLRSGAWELTGLGFFSYIVLSLLFANDLNRRQKGGLAHLTEQLTLLLGLALAVPSLFNPLVRAIYFSLGAIVLSLLWWRRRQRPTATIRGNLVYLSHTTGAIALVAWILWLFPQLSTAYWAGILLVGTLLEWGFAAINRDRFWQNSAWYVGLAQATCAYPLLFANLKMDGHYAYAGLPWLVVPIALAGLAHVPNFAANFAGGAIAAQLSVISLVLSLAIAFTSLNPFLITLMVATGVMFANTAKLRQIPLAVITVGYGLLGVGLQIWNGLDKPEPKWYLVGVAIALWLIWIGRDLLGRWAAHHDAEEFSIPHLYHEALNGWGRGLGLMMGLILGAIVLTGFSLPHSGLPWGELLLAGILSLSAIAYRVWQEPTDLGLWGLAIGAEILVNLTAEWIGSPGISGCSVGPKSGPKSGLKSVRIGPHCMGCRQSTRG
jgi:hypothetical protein